MKFVFTLIKTIIAKFFIYMYTDSQVAFPNDMDFAAKGWSKLNFLRYYRNIDGVTIKKINLNLTVNLKTINCFCNILFIFVARNKVMYIFKITIERAPRKTPWFFSCDEQLKKWRCKWANTNNWLVDAQKGISLLQF